MSGAENISADMRRLTAPDALLLAELYLTKADLDASFEALQAYLQLMQQEGEQFRSLKASLFRDGIVQLAGCFTKNQDKEDKLFIEHVYAGFDGAATYYNWILDLRDTYAAHSFGPLRQCHVGVVILRSGADQDVGVGHTLMIYQGASVEDAQDLMRFISMAQVYLDAKISVLKSRILSYAQKITDEEYMRLELIQMSPPGPEDIRTTRERFHKLTAKRNNFAK